MKMISAQTNGVGQNNNNSLKNKIPFTIRDNKTILSVDIGEVRALRIILDSGMGWDGLLIYNPDFNDSLDLVNPQYANVGGAGKGKSQTVLVSDSMNFSIGNKELTNQKVVVLQTNHFKGFPSDGVIGYSLFGHFTVEINYNDSTFTLHDPDKLHVDKSWESIPIFFKKNNIPWLNAQIVINNEQPIPISCYVDYASSEAIELLLKPDQKFIVPENTREVYLGRGLSGDIYGRKGNISHVILGSFKIKNVDAAFTSAEIRSKQDGADGVIASKLLRRFNLIFDYTNKKLYLKPNHNFKKSF